jgi:hypothetical protein
MSTHAKHERELRLAAERRWAQGGDDLSSVQHAAVAGGRDMNSSNVCLTSTSFCIRICTGGVHGRHKQYAGAARLEKNFV